MTRLSSVRRLRLHRKDERMMDGHFIWFDVVGKRNVRTDEMSKGD